MVFYHTSEKSTAQGRLRIRKHAVLPAPFWLKYNRKKLPIRQYGEIFSADFISKIHWQNCFAPKKSAFCAEPRRAAAGILDVCQGGATMGLRETRLLRRMFSYARRPKGGALFLLADPVILMQMTRRFSRCCKYIHQNHIFCE